MDEELKDIPGYEGRYAVTRDGRVWSHPKRFARTTHSGLWLKSPKNTSGYPVVLLTKEDGTRKTERVHRLVAFTWIPNPLALSEINHIDSDPANPQADNLEWCTRSQNVTHAYRSGKKTARAAMSLDKLAQVRAALASGEQNRSIASRLNVNETTVSGIKTGHLYAHTGETA
jgi:DNA-binding NarL/FixJ family response regulator